jgi:N4-(beta-N-acetylglucosaminyl)-L-asparaginase
VTPWLFALAAGKAIAKSGPRPNNRRPGLELSFANRSGTTEEKNMKGTSKGKAAGESSTNGVPSTRPGVSASVEEPTAQTSRRGFLKKAAAGVGAALGAGLANPRSALENPLLAGTPGSALAARAPKPVVIASANGMDAITKAMEIIQGGGDCLEAVIAGVNLVEDDPEDISVGYGGLPNEDGVIELDSSVMYGPTHRAGAVAALRNIKNPSKVARLVMERTDHVLIVGVGALRFAKAHGFREENLLTDKTREIWLKWKEKLSDRDDWIPAPEEDEQDTGVLLPEPVLEYGTINCDALDLSGNVAGVTTTSGLSFKIPGRVGDSPIIGAGLYVDNEVGASGSTGRGEANLINCNCVMVVEYMRDGKSPEEACLKACKRVVEHNRLPRLKDADGRPNFNVKFYAINTRGEFAGAAIWQGAEDRISKFAIHDGTEAKLLECAYLYEGVPNKGVSKG